MRSSEFSVDMLGVSNGHVVSVLIGVAGETDDLLYQHEYVFCMPFHSLLLPFSHLFHCLPYSSVITELPAFDNSNEICS